MRPSTFQYLANQNQFEDSALQPSIGGQILQFQAGASLNVGDVVQLSAANTVIKATTNGYRTIGVVVGGGSMPDRGIYESNGYASDLILVAAGILAAINGQKVYVLVQGVFYVTSDAAIAVGSSIVPSAGTAGEVAPGSNALTIAAGGVAVTSTGANGAIVSGSDSATPVIGKWIDTAAAGASTVGLAYINIH